MNKITSFRGLNNVADPLRLDLDWLTLADNVDVTPEGALARRDGYALAMAGVITGAYTTEDHQRTYVVDSGALKALQGAAAAPTAVTLRAGLSSARMHWAEINGQVFYNNGTDSGIILPDNSVVAWAWPEPAAPTLAAVSGALAPGLYQVCTTYILPDGRETGASPSSEIELVSEQALQISDICQSAGLTTNVYIAPANSTDYRLAVSRAPSAAVWNFGPDSLGVDLRTMHLAPLPQGADVIQFWGGRAYAALYMPGSNQTAIFPSKALAFHQFDIYQDLILLEGRVLAMAPHKSALIVGTDVAIYALNDKLEGLAPYGVVPGWCWAMDSEDADAKVLLWTTHGLCEALPFANLTSSHVSVAPGTQAGAAVIAQGGHKKFVVALHAGGEAFNAR